MWFFWNTCAICSHKYVYSFFVLLHSRITIFIIDRACHILNTAKIPFHSNANTVILIRQLQSGVRIEIERFYLAGYPCEILQTPFLGSVYSIATYLRDSYFPRSSKRISACNKCQRNRIRLSKTSIDVYYIKTMVTT